MVTYTAGVSCVGSTLVENNGYAATSSWSVSGQARKELHVLTISILGILLY